MTWKTIPASEFCSGVTDGTHDSPKPQSEGRKLITSKHLKGHYIDFESANWIAEEDYQKVIARSAVEQWDILFSMIGTIGNTYLEKNKIIDYVCKNMGIFKFSGNVDKAYWMYYYLKSPQAMNYIQAHLRGSTQSYVPLGTLRTMPVPVPNDETMKKIVSILRPIDEKIETNLKINDNLEQQVYALYDAWFVPFIQTHGEIPANWRKGTLSDIATITSGKRPPMKQATATADVTIPLVGAASIMGFTNVVLYNEPILVTGRVGTHGIVQRFQSPCWTSDNTLVIKSAFYEYTFQILQRVDYVNMNRGSTQPLITQTDLKNVPIIIPTEDVLQKYEEIAGALMAMYESNRKENERLATLRDILLPKLMSGELDVSDIDL